MRLLIAGLLLALSLACGSGELETQAPVNITEDSPRCDPSYPSVCIPPYPPDLDCGEISHRNFVVLRPDPHGFDGDRDGLGCET